MSAITIPGSLNHKSMQFFENSELEHQFTCKLCKKVLNGKKIVNLRTHLQNKHKSEYEKHVAKIEDDCYFKTKRLKKLQSFAEIVSVNGRPFAALLDSGFRKANEEDFKQLQDAGHGINFSNNFSELKEYLKHISVEIQNIIKREVEGKFVSLCADITTKNRRAFLGLTIQYLHAGEIRIRSIAMIQLKQSHTAEYLKAEIEKIMLFYGLTIDNIISFTTDNGKNVIKMVKLFNCSKDNELDDDVSVRVDYDNDEDDSDDDNTEDISAECSFDEIEEMLRKAESEILLNNELNDDDIYAQLLLDLSCEFSGNPFDTISGIKCAAHTIQLAVHEAIRKTDVMKWIILCREVGKDLRKQNFMYEMNEQKINGKAIRLDCVTRWNSTYRMVICYKYI